MEISLKCFQHCLIIVILIDTVKVTSRQNKAKGNLNQQLLISNLKNWSCELTLNPNVIAREFLKLIYGCIYNKNKLTKEKLVAKVSLLTF